MALIRVIRGYMLLVFISEASVPSVAIHYNISRNPRLLSFSYHEKSIAQIVLPVYYLSPVTFAAGAQMPAGGK